MKELILASASPRRHEILTSTGIEHKILTANTEENPPAGLSPAETAVYLAEKKAHAVLTKYGGENRIYLGADTIVESPDKEILGKPKNRDDAVRMLLSLSGRTHRVITGICLCSRVKSISDYSVSKVTMCEITKGEIENYIDKYSPYDKAGAYGIQERAGVFITGIEGDYFNIVGLPVSLVYSRLACEFKFFA